MDPFYHYKQPGDSIPRPHGHPNPSIQNPHHANNASVPSQPVANNYGTRSVPPQYGVPPPSQQPHAGQISHRHQQHQQSQHARPPSSQYNTGQPLQQAQGTRSVYPYSSGQPASTMNASVPQPAYAVPNPLGANGGGGDKRPTDQNELLRSMYHQRQQIQQQRPPSHPTPVQMPPNPSPSLPAPQPPNMAGYRAPAQGSYQQTSQPSAIQRPGNVHAVQHPHQQRAQSYHQNYQNANQSIPPQQQTQNSYTQSRSSAQTPSYSQGQTKAPQQRHAQLQASASSQQQIQQNYQVQQVQQQQYIQPSMRSAPPLHSSQQQQQQHVPVQQQHQQQLHRPTQQPHPQQRHQTPHPSQHHQPQQSHHQQQHQQQSQPQHQQLSQQQIQQQSQQKQKQRFNLTPEAKHALRDAVLSAIRSPTGQIDPVLLQRAMEKGLPKHAIMNAAMVAKERDKKNKSIRVDQNQSSSHDRQEKKHQQSQQQVSSVQMSAGSGRVHPDMPAETNNLQMTHPSSNNSSTYQSQQHQHYTYQQQQQQQQQQQRPYQNQPQHDPQVLQKQYEQQLLEKQQQKLQQQRAEAQRQAELKAAAVAAAKKKKQQEEEERRKRQQIELQRQAQKEQQRRLMEEEKKRKEIEAANTLKAVEAKRVAELRAQMKPWGRTSSALVAKKDAAVVGGGNVASVGSLSSDAPHPHSYWGGTSRCEDTTPALLFALQQQKNEVKSKQLKASVNIIKVKSFANQLRRNLIHQKTIPLEKEEEDMSEVGDEPAPVNTRKKRLAAISTSLLEPERHKRFKLQPKREGKFLEKHIRRARTITADATSRRHKDLLKAITNHQTEFYKFHRLKKTDAARLARAIRDQINKEEKQREKEADQAERARIAALRANDMTAYTSLLEDTKNERLKFLLDKTDECMNQISSLLTSRAEEEEEEIRKAGGEGKMKAAFSEAPTGGSYYETAHVKSEQVRQPSILVGGDLKEYQLSGLQWLVSLYNNRLNGILADEMGLGKTIQTISLIAYLIEVKENLGPYLVIVPLSTLSNWVNEFAKWLPAATVVCYKGTPQQRKDIFRNEVADGHFNVLLTTYEFVIRDKGSLRKLTWQYAIVDEGHRMKNNQSKFAVTLGTHYNTRRRVLLTGTPLQNSLPELWALLNFLLPSIFNSAETFDQWFNKPFSSFGKSSSGGAEGADNSSEELLSNEERMLIIHRLHELLRPFMLRRVKSEVLDQLPEKVEKVIRCELSSWQKELYKQISHKIVGEAQSKNFNRGLNNVVMQLRKVVNHPYLFSKEGYHINEDIIRTSGKMELLDRMLPKLKAAGHRVLMFTQMTKMMPILEDYFAYRGFASLRLDGSTTADEREKRMYMFNAPDSPYFVFLLSTRAGGLGLNLATADTVIIFDSDWNPMMDLQAQDRAHRIGQRKDVRVFRIISQSPVEEKILSRATEKLHMNELVVEAGKFDRSGGGEDGSSLERLKMMEILLTDFDSSQYASQNNSASNSEDDFEKYNDDGDGENSGDLLNEMISSNDDDYNLYCKIDLANNSRPTLYSDIKDVPDWILYPNGKPEEGSEAVDPGAGGLPSKRRAAAGDIVYDDGLTEKQFCRLMDKKASEEDKGKKKRKKKRSRNAVDPSLIIVDDVGRKRSKNSPNDYSISLTPPKKAAASVGVTVDKSGEVTPAVNERLISICRSIIYYKEKGTNRKMSEIFLEKPCPTTYPDYYQLIEKPIGMNDILRKCRAKLYTSIGSFMDDWNTLFKNAVTYNGEGSWIVIDGNHLKNELYRYMEKNNLTTTPTPKKPLRIKLSLKAKKNMEEVDGGKSGAIIYSQNESTPNLNQNSTEYVEGSDSDSDTESGDMYSDVVGMNERESVQSNRGKIKSGGLGSRGGTTRLVRK